MKLPDINLVMDYVSQLLSSSQTRAAFSIEIHFHSPMFNNGDGLEITELESVGLHEKWPC